MNVKVNKHAANFRLANTVLFNQLFISPVAAQ